MPGTKIAPLLAPSRRLHPFVQHPDHGMRDPYTGLGICAACNKVGEPGDAQHPDLGAYPSPAPEQLTLI